MQVILDVIAESIEQPLVRLGGRGKFCGRTRMHAPALPRRLTGSMTLFVECCAMLIETQTITERKAAKSRKLPHG